MTESCQIIKQARSLFQIGDKLCWFCSHETCSRNQDWTQPQCGWILYVAHRPLCGQILDLKEKRIYELWIFASQPFYSLPPAPATFISFSSLWSWWLQSSGCCTCRSRSSSCRRTRSWWLPSASAQVVDRPNGRLPLKVAFYSTTGRVIFQMSALTLAHISNVNIVLRTLATFYKDGPQIQNSK